MQSKDTGFSSNHGGIKSPFTTLQYQDRSSGLNSQYTADQIIADAKDVNTHFPPNYTSQESVTRSAFVGCNTFGRCSAE